MKTTEHNGRQSSRRGRAKWHILPFLFTLAAAAIPATMVTLMGFLLFAMEPIDPEGTDETWRWIGLIVTYFLILALVPPLFCLISAVVVDIGTAKLELWQRLLIPLGVIIAIAVGVTSLLDVHWFAMAVVGVVFYSYWLVFQLNQIALPAISRFIKRKMAERRQPALSSPPLGPDGPRPPFVLTKPIDGQSERQIQ